jgi:hypothetical protein
MRSVIASLCLTLVSAAAGERKFLELLKPGKECIITLAGGYQVQGFDGHAKILETTSDGWAQIEILHRTGDESSKRWVNLSQIVQVELSDETSASSTKPN